MMKGEHLRISLCIGGGVVASCGVLAVLYYYKLRQEKTCSELLLAIRSLSIQLELLTKELNDVRAGINKRKLRSKGGTLKAPSDKDTLDIDSDDDDDVFVDAYGGDLGNFGYVSEYESVKSGTGSSEYFSATSEHATGQQAIFQRVDTLLEGSDDDKQLAFNILQNARLTDIGNDAEFLWRHCKATYFLAQIEGSRGSEEQKKTLVYEAQGIGERALSAAPEKANVHKWYAITLGSMGDYEPTQVKIANGYKFKEHIEKAIALNPEDPSSHYLLGRWCYGVYSLSWIERQLAARLFSSPPCATIEEALNCFLKAEALKPNCWKENELYVAKCFIEKRDYYSAIKWLEKAESIRAVSIDDKTAHEEVIALLQRYSCYRK